MTTISIDLVLTPKLWLADEHAWRVSALNLPGAEVTGLYDGEKRSTFNREGDRVVWLGELKNRPLHPTLHVSVPSDLRSGKDYEQQRIDLQRELQVSEADKATKVLALEAEKANETKRQNRRLAVVAVLTAIIGVIGGFVVKGGGGGGDGDTRECRQALARLQTLTSTAADANDMKKAVQRELAFCTVVLDPKK